MSKTLLRVDASMRVEGSVSRRLADKLINSLNADKVFEVRHRDLAQGVPFVDEAWIGANFTDPAQRSTAQRSVLSQSDAFVRELKEADVLVIATPIYNFNVPAALKAWIDMVARARETFKYTQAGPVGLLEGKKAYVIVTSGGTALGSELDFVSAWMQQVLAFIGITDVQFIDSSALAVDEQAALARADENIKAVA